MTEEKRVFCKIEEKRLKDWIYSRKAKIDKLETALKRIKQKFQEPQYNGDPRQYETIEEICDRALSGK